MCSAAVCLVCFLAMIYHLFAFGIGLFSKEKDNVSGILLMHFMNFIIKSFIEGDL